MGGSMGASAHQSQENNRADDGYEDGAEAPETIGKEGEHTCDRTPLSLCGYLLARFQPESAGAADRWGQASEIRRPNVH